MTNDKISTIEYLENRRENLERAINNEYQRKYRGQDYRQDVIDPGSGALREVEAAILHTVRKNTNAY